LTKGFGGKPVWSDVTLTLPAGEISVLLGPSGTGKSVFLKTLVGLLHPDRGSIWIAGHDLPRLSERDLYEVRKLFGVLFQDGALFGSMNIFDNVAFLDPEIVLFDEPDSGLDPVRTAYLNQLIIDLNQQTDATFLIVTHDINTARTVPDNIGLIYHGRLAMFGPREMLLSSTEPVVRQFLNAQRVGPIGMAEEKDADELAAEAASGVELPPLPPIPHQLRPSNGEPRRGERRPGQWCHDNGVALPPGSFADEPPAWPSAPSEARATRAFERQAQPEVRG
jgi:phospholipid/cholesterol/gamma-HCH transport system ATP-binding protein